MGANTGEGREKRKRNGKKINEGEKRKGKNEKNNQDNRINKSRE